MSRIRWRPLAVGIILFGAGFFIGQFWYPGFFLNEWYPGFFLTQLIGPAANSACLKQYPLTSQSLDCSTYDDSAARLKSVDSAIDEATSVYIKEGKATSVSVWVRDLEAKQTASNNENQRYAPASLLKLPLMIAYFKLADIDPSILSKTLVYTDSGVADDSIQDIPSPSTLVAGQSYTVEQLIEDMIINSDNNATTVLVSHLDPQVFTDTLLDLGIKIPSADNSMTRDFLTAKVYAGIFRMLYNSSYLSRDYSQKALDIMSKTTFKGIATALPQGTIVAHKFGEREVDNPDGSVEVRELHDCGIIYKNSTPYTLCIMTQGKSFADLESVIESLSKTVYDKI